MPLAADSVGDGHGSTGETRDADGPDARGRERLAGDAQSNRAARARYASRNRRVPRDPLDCFADLVGEPFEVSVRSVRSHPLDGWHGRRQQHRTDDDRDEQPNHGV